MREIKFRAWIEKFRPFGEEENDAHMSESFSFQHFDEDYFVPEGCYLRNMNIMQYTGLKDKNGKEIYEGDIVKNRWGDNKEVSFSEIDFCTYDGSCAGYGFVLEDQHLSDYKQTVEIIGNIYENPELIK